jgi:hypothetical protein
MKHQEIKPRNDRNPFSKFYEESLYYMYFQVLNSPVINSQGRKQECDRKEKGGIRVADGQ